MHQMSNKNIQSCRKRRGRTRPSGMSKVEFIWRALLFAGFFYYAPPFELAQSQQLDTEVNFRVRTTEEPIKETNVDNRITIPLDVGDDAFGAVRVQLFRTEDSGAAADIGPTGDVVLSAGGTAGGVTIDKGGVLRGVYVNAKGNGEYRHSLSMMTSYVYYFLEK